MHFYHEPPAPLVPPLPHSASRSSDAAVRTVAEVSTEQPPLRLEYQAARQVGPALACRCVSPSSTAGLYPRPLHHLDTVTHALLGHIGGGRQPSTPEQIAVCSFLDSLNKSHQASLQPGEHDPFMVLAQQQDSQGYSLLYRAVSKNLTGLVECLLNRQPASFSATELFTGKKDEQTTPLHLAAKRGAASMVSLLLEKNADVNSRDSCRRTPLFRAVESGYEKTARVLLDKGADANIRNKSTNSPLHQALKRGYNSIARLLLDKGADANLRDGFGSFPLTLAIQGGDIDIVGLLVDKGADLHTLDGRMRTVLHVAIEQSNKDIAHLLLDRGADINSRAVCGQTPLHYAAEQGNMDMVTLLVHRGADVNSTDREASTPLHWAVCMEQEQIACFLLENNADVSWQNHRGKTALQLAADTGKAGIIHLLIEKGADVSDLEGYGGPHLALVRRDSNGHIDTIRYNWSVKDLTGSDWSLCNIPPQYVSPRHRLENSA